MKWPMRPLLLLCGLVAADLGLAQIGLPQLPPLPAPEVRLPAPVPLASDALVQPVVSSVKLRAGELMRRYPRDVERDPRGSPVVRAVILALSPSDQALEQARARGFQVQGDEVLQPLGERVVTLLVPAGLSTRRALRLLREADPQGRYDFDHLFVESGLLRRTADEGPVGASPPTVAGMRVGLVDGGVDAAHPVFQARPPQVSGCRGRPVPSAHGTAVASLFVGDSPQFRGGAPGAQLFAVDIYCDGSAPGGRVRDIVLALNELAAAQVRVINISVVGPDNAVLAAVVRNVLAQSIIVVAAAGNDGPDAPPLFPAAYPGVVAVTGVDAHAKVLLEACGGGHVRLAAPGADMLAAMPGGGFAPVRGTSYAAPLVAGLLASRLARSAASGDQAIEALVAAATDLGRKGRDRRYGYGVVGMELRVDPASLAGKAPAR